ncbi:trehalose operon repressor [Desertibacillus haloalkaliphilus]|uniref:trehalose operon repressor n=1 Tax=Desertibacillus haloalkaliphilus TaxID=1328930 RepID=UPI001C2550CC|nr:trehalose operon repressor [Desertibacillus haloalkaliphilus]MBU8907978.1 trehalose operon repressor [Desertibacillus haloalkaliphilus]
MKKNKYYKIFEEIATEIDKGEFPPRTMLPSEHDLSEQYSTSRETIRKALTLLSQNGYIQKVRGKGSIVLDRSKFNFPISGLVSFKEIADQLGNESKTIVHELQLISPDCYVSQQLNVSSKDEVWKVVRSRSIDGETIILDKDYFCRKVVPTLTKAICEHSIYEYLEKELGLTISFAKKEIVVEECTDEDRKYLDLRGYDHIVIVKNYVYLDDTTLIQYTESRHRLDKFRFVDFARRK